ncbi:MAG: class I SAM-dependent methyltransferase, partial [Parvibaculales bacterium]
MADSVAEIFDRSLLKKRKERAGRRKSEYAPLLAGIADALAERIAEIKRDFPLGVCLGAHGEAGAELHKQVGKLVDCALSQTLLGAKGGIVLDEEHLPFAEKSLDIIISFLTLHHINQIPKLLVQARKALHPDGVLLGVQIGAGSLDELRQVLAQAEE